MKVEHMYRAEVYACNIGDPLRQVARQMRQHSVGVLAVRDQGRLAGVVSERDLVAAVAAGADMNTATAGDHASRDVQACDIDDDSTEVAHRMLAEGIPHMPVVHDGQLIGIVSMRDLLAAEVWA